MSVAPSDLVAQAARVLWGEHWSSGDLSRELGLNERTARRLRSAVHAGQPYPVAPGLLSDLARLLRERAAAATALARRLAAASPRP